MTKALDNVTQHYSHDELARESYVLSLKQHINTDMADGLKTVYQQSAVPAFTKAHGRPPKDRHEIRRQMLQEDYFQVWGSLWRTSQHLMWEGVETSLDRQLPELNERARVGGGALGSLTLDPDLEVPRYVTAVNIHEQPGGYGYDLGEGDVSAGAFYDGAARIYGRGQGLTGSHPALAVIAYLHQQYPELEPTAILDEGCSTGGSTPVYADVFPDADIHAIDVSAGMLRYGHAKMEALGIAVHFSQQSAEQTDFEDESFDLIVSNIMLHETSAKAVPNIMRECHRILKPGGVMVHMEVPLRHKDMDLYMQWYRDWSTHFNNEPFWGKLHDMDVVEPIVKAGFQRSKVFDVYLPAPEGEPTWWACGAQK